MRPSQSLVGSIIAKGYASWTLDQDASKEVDLTFNLGPGYRVLLVVRNGSAVVDLTAHYGNVVKLYTARDPDIPDVSVACTMALATDLVTATAHGLLVGDAITFGATTGGVTVGTVYYVIAVATADTFQFATARGASAFNITANGANTFSTASEHAILGTLAVEKFSAASSTTPVRGIEQVVVEGACSPFRVLLTKSAATAAAFTARVELRRI